jgi:hypothetical protein
MTHADGAIVLILLAAGACLLIVVLVAKMLDRRVRRDGEAIAIKGLISDALDGDPNLFGTSITLVRVRVPLWAGSPMTIRVAGQVPSDQLRKAALQSIKRAAKSDLLVAVRIKSRIAVKPAEARPRSEQRDRIDRRAGRVL